MNTPTPPPILLKVGGNEIDDDGFLAGFVAAVAELRRQAPVAIVHGGGKEIGELHRRLDVPFGFVEGLRVTTPDSLRLVEMVLSGSVNTRLTRWLVNGGVSALGVSGVDLGLVRVESLRPNGVDIGYVGRIVSVQAEPLLLWLAEGVTPVISPISLGVDGQSYNVNADQVAAAVAVAVCASRLVFVSNVPGVLLHGAVAPELSIGQVEAHIADGQIFGGMIPKVRAAIEAVQAGAPAAVITNLAGLAAGGGTVVRSGES
jgi:acetylglutamate kinase